MKSVEEKPEIQSQTEPISTAASDKRECSAFTGNGLGEGGGCLESD